MTLHKEALNRNIQYSPDDQGGGGNVNANGGTHKSPGSVTGAGEAVSYSRIIVINGKHKLEVIDGPNVNRVTAPNRSLGGANWGPCEK